MASYEFDTVKAEKAEATDKYNKQIKLYRVRYLLEICAVVVSIPWFFNWIPTAVKFSGDYLRELVAGFFHRTFYVFLLTNVMVLVLAVSYYMKSDGEESRSDIHDEFVKASQSRRGLVTVAADETAVPEEKSEVVDKEIVFSEKAVATTVDSVIDQASVTESVNESTAAELSLSPVVLLQCGGDEVAQEKKSFERSRTELYRKTSPAVSVKAERELRRSETEKCGKIGSSVEDMSSEEFRDRIEEFIAMQKKMQLEEYRKEARILSYHHNTQPCLAIALKSH